MVFLPYSTVQLFVYFIIFMIASQIVLEAALSKVYAKKPAVTPMRYGSANDNRHLCLRLFRPDGNRLTDCWCAIIICTSFTEYQSWDFLNGRIVIQKIFTLKYGKFLLCRSNLACTTFLHYVKTTAFYVLMCFTWNICVFACSARHL